MTFSSKEESPPVIKLTCDNGDEVIYVTLDKVKERETRLLEGIVQLQINDIGRVLWNAETLLKKA